MAMTVNGLRDAIIAALGTAEDAPKQSAFATAIATAVVNYLKSNASVPAGIPVATTGTAAAQTGTTQAAGTIT